jgi:toxin ParE1/3/4
MGDVRLSPAAARDLQKIVDDIASAAGGGVAQSFMTRMRHSIEHLADYPQLGRRRPYFGQDVRSWAFPPYVAFYRQIAFDVEIIRVVHGRRRITRSLLRER